MPSKIELIQKIEKSIQDIKLKSHDSAISSDIIKIENNLRKLEMQCESGISTNYCMKALKWVYNEHKDEIKILLFMSSIVGIGVSYVGIMGYMFKKLSE